MKKSFFFLFILLSISFFSCQDEDNIVPDPIPIETNQLLQLNGNQLVDSNKNPIYLEGVAFGNEIWQN